MRVALISPFSPLPGGIAAHAGVLRAALSRAGHEVSAFGFRRMYPSPLHPNTGRDRTMVGGSAEPVLDALDPRTWKHLRRRLECDAFDRVIVEWWHPWFSRIVRVTCGGLSAPVTLVCHNIEPHEPYPGWRRATRRALSVADGLVCHSRFVASLAEGLAPTVPRQLCPMPALLPSPGQLDKPAARRLLGLRPQARLVLFAGHVRPYKGLDVLLAAWDRVASSPLAALVIAGPSYIGHERLQRKIRRQRRARAVMVVDRYLEDEELAAWLTAADVLVLPYTRASQSGLVASAAVFGTRIVASDVGGLGEQARDLGATLVQAGSVASLAGALERVLGQPHDATRRTPAERGLSALRDYTRDADATARACLSIGYRGE